MGATDRLVVPPFLLEAPAPLNDSPKMVDRLVESSSMRLFLSALSRNKSDEYTSPKPVLTCTHCIDKEYRLMNDLTTNFSRSQIWRNASDEATKEPCPLRAGLVEVTRKSTSKSVQRLIRWACINATLQQSRSHGASWWRRRTMFCSCDFTTSRCWADR